VKNTVLTNLTLIDCTGKEPEADVSVRIEGNFIKEITKGKPGNLSSSTEIIDCKKGYLLPGLIDAHVHAGLVDNDLAAQQRDNFPSMLVIKGVRMLQETLMQGFTTARDAGGVDPGFRQAIDAGMIQGPRLLVSGACISQTGGHGDLRLPTESRPPSVDMAGFETRICDGVDAVRREVREQLRTGVDQIKVMASGGAGTPSDELETSQYSLDELKAAVEEAEAAGKYVMAHCYSNRGAVLCVDAGIRSIEHGNLLNQNSAKRIKEAGSYLVPTLATYEMLHFMGPEKGIPAYFQKKIDILWERSFEALDIAYKEGVKIASGSDVIGDMQAFKGIELALKARVMGAMPALEASTKVNAELLKMSEKVGTVEVGKLADLIVVNQDPLKDMNVFKNYQENIQLIMQDGVLVKNIL